MKKASPVVFLDRDGTILTERGYLSDPKKIYFYKGAIDSLRQLKKRGYKLIVVSNQSGVGRGFFTLKKLGQIHRVFSKKLSQGGAKLSGFYFCPHLPESRCACRKPKLGLIIQAQKEHKINMRASYMIGDQFRDVLLAKRAGLKSILVLTGAGRNSRNKAKPIADKITRNLSTGVHWILNR